MKIGSRKRFTSNALGEALYGKAKAEAAKADSIVSGLKSRTGFVEDQGKVQAASIHERLGPGKVSAAGAGGSSGGSGGSGGTSGFGGGFGSGSDAVVDRYNPIYDDLSRGTVAEDWIPRDPRLQNRMFRIMYNRGAIEGPVVETIAEMVWSDFDLAGIKDKTILDTFWAAKDSVRIDRYLEDISKELLVIGHVVPQFILDSQAGIWSDMIIHDSDYLDVSAIPRTGYMPKVDLLPSPEMQAWAKSNDPRDVESRKGMPRELMDSLTRNQPIPLDPTTTAYIPRRSFFNDVYGTSFFVRNIPLWGLEKSLINATLTGHRRRSGPITHISVGSELWEPTGEQIEAIVAAYTAAEEDSVSSTIGTRYGVEFNQVRGGLQEMWKWSDEWSFLQEAKLKMFGFSEQILSGDMSIDTSTVPTVFLNRLRAHRNYIVQTLLIQKFFRSLAILHNFRRRTPAELQHRIIINDDDHTLVLPSLVFHKNLDSMIDLTRADILEKMEEKGLPVGMAEWNRTLGGGEFEDRMRTACEDLEFRLKAMQFQSIKQRVLDLQEAASDTDNLKEETDGLLEELKQLDFSSDSDGYDINELSPSEKKKAAKMDDGVVSSNVIAPDDVSISGSAAHDLSLDRSIKNKDPDTLSSIGKVC